MGADVGADVGADGAEYCCSGCRIAHALVTSGGLDRYYALADAPLPTGREAPGERPWLAPLVADAQQSGGASVLSLDVQGVSCAACVWVIEKLGERRALACRVNPGVGRLEVDARAPELGAFLDDVERLGYRLGPPQKSGDRAADDLLVRAGLCCAFAMNAMIFAFARYFGLAADSDVGFWFRVGEVVIATASVAVGGSWFIKTAGRALLRGIVHLDLPIALGVILAYGGSLLSAWLSSTESAYFDTVSVFIALMLLGRLAQRRLLLRGRALLLADEGVDGIVVRKLVDGGRVQMTPAGALRAGDRLLVVPGELVPCAARVAADAIADAGGADVSMSLAWITGEAEPRAFHAGDLVPAGAHNAGTRAVVMVAEEDMARSRLHTLLAARPVDEPDASPFWRVYATASVAAVLFLGALAVIVWWHAGPVRALEVATAVLVVTCPCAIGLAIPLAGELAAAQLRRRGVYLRRPGFLDRVLAVEHVVLDKTGTVTLAELRLDDASRASLAALDERARAALYDLCARSSHPKSRALVAALAPGRRDDTRLEGAGAPEARRLRDVVVEEIAGVGLSCAALGAELRGDALYLDGARVISFRFVEALQRDARREVDALQARGKRVHIASGDAAARVEEVAARLGVPRADVHAEMSPEGKAALVRALGADRVLVVGDGVNDAPAFAAAACAGTPALDRPQLPARADFISVSPGVGPLALIFDVARTLRRASMAAVAFALVYNAVAVTLALTGHMTPLLCAVLMPSSSLLVISLVTVLMRRPPPLASQAQSQRPQEALAA